MPAGLYFEAQDLPVLSMPIEIGARQENPVDEKGILYDNFRNAYLEALLRGVSLTGTLGSDRVNPWPADNPQSWSQNWASAEELSIDNSWGFSNLVLALGDYRLLGAAETDGNRDLIVAPVFAVYGPILDLYGKSTGYNRANGVVGYGVPVGEIFFSEGAAVQRFSRGRMIASREGGRFSFQQENTTSLLSRLSPERKASEFGGRGIPQEVANAFAYTWAFVFSEKEGTSDGPVVKVIFPKPWVFEAGSEEIVVKGFYYKSYNRGRDILVLADSDRLPTRAHILSGPILQAILSGKRLPGLGLERVLGKASGQGLRKSLTTGFALYGPPLSDPLPLPNKDAKDGDLFLEAQRFARGWIVVKAPSKLTGPETGYYPDFAGEQQALPEDFVDADFLPDEPDMSNAGFALETEEPEKDEFDEDVTAGSTEFMDIPPDDTVEE